ncbi:pyridoxal 5'-phosphate synthase glutaminase subunit PdxT [Patescibacteria group bacterium]|nr:pyridoxal 5'-phosphate synthase glutaminase subunit PdxT [Patescibacteria group bacterium]
MSQQNKIVGVFAIQGAFIEHKRMLEDLGINVILIRDLSDVVSKKIDAVILPGGESTTMTKLLKKTGLDAWLVEQVESGLPIFGTCAGMILLSQMSLIDIEVDRNAYGSQLDSFEAELNVQCLRRGGSNVQFPFHGIFIRAPKVKKIGNGVKVLSKHDNVPVLIQQNNILVGSFHPELTENPKIHEYFLGI